MERVATVHPGFVRVMVWGLHKGERDGGGLSHFFGRRGEEGGGRAPWGLAVGGQCVSLTTVSQQEERPIRQILYLGNLLETCHFQSFWVRTHTHTRTHTHKSINTPAHTHTHPLTLLQKHGLHYRHISLYHVCTSVSATERIG